MYDLSVPPSRLASSPPIHRLLFLNRERLDRFLLSPLPPSDGRVSHRLLNETERGYPLMRSFLIRLPEVRRESMRVSRIIQS